MKGRRPGRPTKWVVGSVEQQVEVDKAGFKFTVYHKWKQKDKRVGTLIVSIGGIRWRAPGGKLCSWMDWNAVEKWLSRAG